MLTSGIRWASREILRGASCLVPGSWLFRIGQRVRSFRIRLGTGRLGGVAGRLLDHLIVSLRPAVVEAQVRWPGATAPMYLRADDPNHYDLALGLHEPPVARWLASHITEGVTFLDVGANVGYYTLMAARLAGGAGRVVAIEADPEVARLLRENVRRSNHTGVEVVVGLADSACGRGRLGRARATGWSSKYAARPVEWVEVPSLTVDSVVERLGLERLDLVKVDVEGAELDVLRGMPVTLSQLRPKLLIESHSPAGAALLEDALESHGYRCEWLDPGCEQEHLVAEPKGTS